VKRPDPDPRHALIRAALDHASALSAADRTRLRQAREQALAGRGGRQSRAWPLWPSSALATAVLLLMVLQTNLARVDAPGRDALDADLIGSATDLALLEELEFYEWLDADGGAG